MCRYCDVTPKPAPRSRRASRLMSSMKEIGQNSSARYGNLAGAIREWLAGGPPEKIITAIDVAATDYMFFHRPRQRIVVQNRVTYEWAENYRIRLGDVEWVRLDELVKEINEMIEGETGRSDMIIYRPGKAEVVMRIKLLRSSLASVLHVVVNMEQAIVSGARVMYDDKRIIIDHEFVDTHCCPRKW